MNWTSTLNQPWVGVVSGVNGTGDGMIVVQWQANTTTASRVDTLKVVAIGALQSPQTIVLTQAASQQFALVAPSNSSQDVDVWPLFQ